MSRETIPSPYPSTEDTSPLIQLVQKELNPISLAERTSPLPADPHVILEIFEQFVKLPDGAIHVRLLANWMSLGGEKKKVKELAEEFHVTKARIRQLNTIAKQKFHALLERRLKSEE